MQYFEFSLIVLACVIGSAVLCQVVRRLSLPLVQIAVGCVVALLVPTVNQVHIPSELFLVLFIAPLLFNEARNTDPRELWENKGSILSLAVGLVLLTVLVVGFTLNWFVPSIQLAAAFAAASALAPTDAAAVGALGSSVSLKKRQSTLLSGESLINDASGVVAFQFASAAAITGTFSVVNAGGEFLVLFFGGIALGAALGAAGKYSVRALRRLGYESTTVHVLYEIFSPFFVFLLAEWVGVSGILAVVAAGLVMAERQERMTSATAAQRQLMSNGFWNILVFLINSVVFILLGIQLPQAFAPAIADQFSFPFLLGVVALTTALIMGCRFVWVLAMESVHRLVLKAQRARKHRRRTAESRASVKRVAESGASGSGTSKTNNLESGASKTENLGSGVRHQGKGNPSCTSHEGKKCPHWKDRIGSLLHNALVLTIGGPKGAVTLSIIFTLPYYMADGYTPFPNRDLIIFLTASVILCTLVLADVLLPLLAPREDDETNEEEIKRATIRVLEGTLEQLETMLERGENPKFEPALRLTISHYQVRLMHERESMNSICSKQLDSLTAQVRKVQEDRARKVHKDGGHNAADLAPYFAMLRKVRQSVGYDGTDVNVGSRFNSLRGRLGLLWQQTKRNEVDDEETERLYYDTCLFAILLEHAAIDYLEDVIDADDERKHAAQVLLQEHNMALNSLWSRINYGQEVKQEDRPDITLGHFESLPDGMRPMFGKQFIEASRYADAVDADALTTELDQIRHLQEHGEISIPVANELRQKVYVLQMTLAA